SRARTMAQHTTLREKARVAGVLRPHRACRSKLGPSDHSPAAWRSTWAAPTGPSLESVRPMSTEIARNVGCEVLIDHRQGYLYFGALTDPGTAWADPADAELMERLGTEDRWTHIWAQVLKQGANP